MIASVVVKSALWMTAAVGIANEVVSARLEGQTR
jgi:hypothetical protein